MRRVEKVRILKLRRKLRFRSYWGVQKNINDYYRILKDLFSTDDLKNYLREAYSQRSERNVLKESVEDFLNDYFSQISDKINSAIASIGEVLFKSWVKGQGRVFNRKGENVALTTKIKDRSAINQLAQDQLKYLNNTFDIVKLKINNIVMKGLQNNTPYEELVKELNRKIDGVNKRRAMVIARSEVVKAHNLGQFQMMKEVGAKSYLWVSAGDDRVCPICKKFDGKTFPLSDSSPKPVVSTHPNCRCAILINE